MFAPGEAAIVLNTGFRPEDREHELKVVRTKPDDKNRPMTVSTADIEPRGYMVTTVNYHRYAKQSSAELIAEGAIS